MVEAGTTKEIFLNPKNKLTKEFVTNISHDELEFYGEEEQDENEEAKLDTDQNKIEI